MNRSSQPAIRTTRTGAARLAVTTVIAGIALLCWVGPARSQEGATSAGTPGSQPGVQQPGPASLGESGGAREAGETAKGKEGAKSEIEIELPTWITGALKNFYYSGPATVNADAVLGPDGSPLPEEQVHGKTVDFKFVDEHWNGETKPTWPLHATIEKAGKAKPGPTARIEEGTLDGNPVRLVNPAVEFKYAAMFPEKILISVFTAFCIGLVAMLLCRGAQRLPTKTQTVLEMTYEALDTNIKDLIGPHYKKYVPFIATAFLYILVMNLAGLIPGWTSPTSNINVTAGLSIVVVAYVQYEGIRVNGFVGYLKHFVGEPWWLFALSIPLHVVGEFAKVLSLTIRLFGNIFGEDVVIVILIALAGMFTRGFFPVQAPMYLLAIFTSFVQAMVFSILASVYIALKTSHDHGEEHGSHGHDDHGHIHDVPAPATVA